MNINQFVEELIEECRYTYFDMEKVIKEYKENTDDYEKCLYDKPTYRWLTKEKLEQKKQNLNRLTSLQSLTDNDLEDEAASFVIDKVNAITFILKEIYDIDLTSPIDKVQLTGWTSMHNSCADVPMILKDILTYFDFKYPDIKKLCERKDD
jgi:hypothetical protein